MAQSFVPINELSTYMPRWTIRARVTSRNELRSFPGKKAGGGDFKVFGCELLDNEGGEIRASFFNEAAESFSNMIQAGKCYTFSKGSVRVAKRQYSNCNHRYELVFDKMAQITEAADVSDIGAMKFSVVDLRTVQSKPLPCSVDICGILVSAGPTVSLTSKEGQPLVKRDVVIADDTATSMTVAIWGERAQQEDSTFEGNPVVAMKGVAVKDWQGGRSGSLSGSGILAFKPDIPETQKVQEWWSKGGNSQTLVAISQTTGSPGSRAPVGKPVDLGQMREASQLVGDQPEVYSVTCRLSSVQTRKQGEAQPLVFMACAETKEGSTLPCNRRVDGDGFCAVCNRAGKTAARLTLRCHFSDYSGDVWLTTFHEAAQRAISMTAEDVRNKEAAEGGREALEMSLQKQYMHQPLQLTVRSRLDTYNGEIRTNSVCIDARPVARGVHGRKMLEEIREMLAASWD